MMSLSLKLSTPPAKTGCIVPGPEMSMVMHQSGPWERVYYN